MFSATLSLSWGQTHEQLMPQGHIMVPRAGFIFFVAALGIFTQDAVRGEQRAAAHTMYDKSTYSGNGESKGITYIIENTFVTCELSLRTYTYNHCSPT